MQTVQPPQLSDSPVGPQLGEKEFQLLRNLIYQESGISLRDGKASMLGARLSKRLRQLNLNSFEAYYRFLRGQAPKSNEYRLLINSVTTNKTSFFREEHHFDFLKAHLKQEGAGGRLRIWSSACSSGQEPYSIAITVAEALGSLAGKDIRILASDIDTQVLRAASEGSYDADGLADMPFAFRSRYLQREETKTGTRFRIKPELRDLVTFRHKNLAAADWSINTRFDFVFCRNVLIYFDHETQDRILRRFIGYLKPGGHLMVGHSEHLHWLGELLEPVGQTIYRVKDHEGERGR